MYFRSLGTKYRSASPRLTARTVLFTIWLGLVPKHSQSIFHSYFGLNKHKTDPKNRSQRCFGSVGATEPCTVWVVCAVARNTFHKRNFTESNPAAFRSKTTRICKSRQCNVISNSGQFLAPRKWVFDPQGWNIARLPSPERFSICTPVLEPKTQLSWSFQFYLARIGTQGYDRKKRTYHNGVLEVSGGSMMLWTVALLLAIRLLRQSAIQ